MRKKFIGEADEANAAKRVITAIWAVSPSIAGSDAFGGRLLY